MAACRWCSSAATTAAPGRTARWATAGRTASTIPSPSATAAARSASSPRPGFFFQSACQGDGSYTLREKNGLTYTFESVAGTVGQKAKLLRIADRTGNALTLNYAGNLLSGVSDVLGRGLAFSYAGGRISQIGDWTGRGRRPGPLQLQLLRCRRRHQPQSRHAQLHPAARQRHDVRILQQRQGVPARHHAGRDHHLHLQRLPRRDRFHQ